MKNKFNRFLALALNVSLIAGLAACGSTAATEESKPAETSAVVEESVAAEDAAAEETTAAEEEIDKTPITLTWMVTGVTNTGVLTDTNPALQYIYDQTGIEIEFVPYDLDMLTLRASGGDLTDIVMLDYNIAPQLIESEQIIPLDDLLDRYGQNVVAHMETALEASRDVVGNSEHIYSIPCKITTVSEDNVQAEGATGFRIRADIYEAIGSPEMNSLDDLLDVLAQMQEYQRNATGRDDIYGTCFRATAGAGSNSCAWVFHYGYENWNYGSAVHSVTGEIAHLLADPESCQWEAVEFWNKAYRMGILHPDSFTSSDPLALVGEGTSLSSIKYDDELLDKETHGENAVMVYPEGVFEYYAGVYGLAKPFGFGLSNTSTAISSNCEYPERAMQLIDFLNSDEGMRVIYNGLQGVHWDYVDGVPTYIGEIAEAYEKSIADGEAARNEVIMPCVWSFANAGGGTILSDGYPAEISNSESFHAIYTDPAYVNYASKYDPSFTTTGQVYDSWIKAGEAKTGNSDKGGIIYGLMGMLSDENIQKYQAVNEIFKANIAKLLTAESDEAFEELKLDVIEQFMETGLGDVDAELDVLHAEAVKAYEALMAE